MVLTYHTLSDENPFEYWKSFCSKVLQYFIYNNFDILMLDSDSEYVAIKSVAKINDKAILNIDWKWAPNEIIPINAILR